MAGNTKRLGLLVGLLAVLLLVIVLVRDPFGWKGGGEEQGSDDSVELISATDGEITRIRIKQPDKDEFFLVREGELWHVEKPGSTQKYRINPERLEALLTDLPGLKGSSVASDSADKHATFEVDEAKAIALDVYAGGEEPAVSLLVGKAAEGYKSSFVRRVGEDVTYRSSANVKSLVGFAFEDYRAKKAWEYKPEHVESFSIRRPEDGSPLSTFTLEEGIWKAPGGGNGNQNMINELLDKVAALSVSEFVDTPDDAVTLLAGKQPNLIVKTPAEEFSLTIGATVDSQVYVMDGQGFVYRISEYNLKPYTELDFDRLVFDDTAAGEAQPDEGISDSGLPADSDEDAETADAAEDSSEAEAGGQ